MSKLSCTNTARTGSSETLKMVGFSRENVLVVCVVISMVITHPASCMAGSSSSKQNRFLTSNKSFFGLEPRASSGEPSGDEPGPRVRREASSADLSADEIAVYLDKHNELRGQTDPQAANMKYMEWDSTLATMAQQWSDMCRWEHGQPTNISPFTSIGQNLYITSGGTPTTRLDGARPVQAWFDEDQYYDFDTNTCQTNKVCGHYTQVVWASSYAVGCAQAYCGNVSGISWENSIYVTCNYGPAGNYPRQPFTAGTPCTQCDTGIGQCQTNQCRPCSTHSDECVCAQVCHNCGTLDSAACTCACPNGFYGADCSIVCENTNSNCGANPGWPSFWCDDDHSYVLDKCPALCGLCVAEQDQGYTCDATTSTAPLSSSAAQPATAQQATNAATDLVTMVPTTTCTALSCSNGGSFDSSSCECVCTSEYQGNTCQHEREQARYGVRVILLANIAHWDYIEPYIIQFVADILTSFCNYRFELCCPNSGTKNTAERLSYVNESHVITATGYPEEHPTISGAFTVMFLVTPPATTALCEAGTLSRRRRDTESLTIWSSSSLRIHKRAVGDGPYLDQDVLLEALEENMDNLTMALSGLNVSVSVQGVEAGQEEPIVTQSTPTEAPVPGGLSVGVIVAIVVAVPLIVIITVVVSILVCTKIVKPRKIDPALSDDNANGPLGKDNHGMTDINKEGNH